MAQQTINTGSDYNDPSADNMRTAFTKVNDNDTELYTKFPSSSTGDSIREIVNDPNRSQFLEVDPDGTASLKAIQYWQDAQSYVHGREYVFHVHDVLNAGNIPKVIFTGDSTVSGTSITGLNKLNDLFEQMSAQDFAAWNVLNTAISGTNTFDWANGMVQSDMALNPDLYIVRFGVNDGGTPTLRANFRANLRAGLTYARSQRNLQNMTIILMTANSTNDIPNGRDVDWDEQMNVIVREEAHNFLCVFIDTFALWPDSDNASFWMDSPYPDPNIHIHPLNNFNWSIASVIYQTVFPKMIKDKFGSTGFRNNAAAMVTPSATLSPPSDFSRGLTMYRAPAGNGWPWDGQVVTFRQNDGVWFQLNAGLGDAFASYRTSFNSSTWNPWISLGVPTAIVTPAPSSPLTDFPSGLSVWQTGGGWPLAGAVATFRNSEGAGLQILYQTSAGNGVQFRTWNGSSWNGWLILPALNVANTWTAIQTFTTANFTTLGDYANDAAAAVGGVPVNGLYRNGSVVQIRVT